MAGYNPSFLPKGDIYPSRFVKMDGSPWGVIQASAATDKIIGVSGVGTQIAPGITGADGLAGRNGGPGIRIHGDGEQELIELGGTVDEGDLLKSDSDGKAVAVSFAETTNVFSGGRALEAGVSGNFIRMAIQVQTLRPA